MSISALNYTPSAREGKDAASKIAYAKEIADFDGSDLGTPDTFGQLPFLKDFVLSRSSDTRTDNFWNGDEFTLGSSKSAEATVSVVARLKAVLIDMVEAIEGKLYLFLVEMNDVPIHGKYQIAGFMGEFTGIPNIQKDPTAEFVVKIGKATADVTVDLATAAPDLAAFTQTLGVGAELTISEGQLAGMYEADWA